MLRVRLDQQGFAVVAKAIVPATCASATLPEQLRVLWPERFQTSSAAKRHAADPWYSSLRRVNVSHGEDWRW